MFRITLERGLIMSLFSQCGPKNGGRFSYMSNGKLRIGLNHRPMTKMARMAFLTVPKKGWRVS